MQRRGRFPAGQMVLYHRGQLVLDEAVGDGITGDTQFCVWSASKPLIAMTVAHLEERGLLDVRAPVASVLRGFEANGKGDITILDVLTHRSGVVVPELGQERSEWSDWTQGLARVMSATPRYKRGTLVYHPYEYGWILAAVIEAVTGKRFVDVFDAAIAEPADIRPARFFVEPHETKDVVPTHLLGGKPIVVSGVRYDKEFEAIASHDMLTSFVPGGSMITTARALASFYAMIVAGGVAANGNRVFEATTTADYTRPHASGWDPLNRLPFKFARGFLVGSVGPSLFGPWRTESCFGHGGALCSFGFGDPKLGVAGAIVTNGNWSIREFVLRFGRLVYGLRSAGV